MFDMHSSQNQSSHWIGLIWIGGGFGQMYTLIILQVVVHEGRSSGDNLVLFGCGRAECQWRA
jgi:hypothetical protein